MFLDFFENVDLSETTESERELLLIWLCVGLSSGLLLWRFLSSGLLLWRLDDRRCIHYAIP
jgi:hypothetical protein